MRCSAAWVVAILLGWVVPVKAQPTGASKTVALSWVRLPGAERCGDTRELASKVDAHLQRSAFVAPALAQLQIEASVEPTPSNAWKLRIALFDASRAAGTRELLVEQPSCAEVIDAAALAIAVMIDPDAALHPPSPPVAALPEAPAPRPEPQAAPREPAAPSVSPPRCVESPPAAEVVHWHSLEPGRNHHERRFAEQRGWSVRRAAPGPAESSLGLRAGGGDFGRADGGRPAVGRSGSIRLDQRGALGLADGLAKGFMGGCPGRGR